MVKNLNKKISNGELRTPVTFFSSQIEEGVDGRDVSFEKVYYTFAKIYGPSSKDLELATGTNKIAKFTLKIRDPLTAYNPQNDHFVEIHDSRNRGIKYDVINIRPDYDDRVFLTVVIGGGNNGR